MIKKISFKDAYAWLFELLSREKHTEIESCLIVLTGFVLLLVGATLLLALITGSVFFMAWI